MVKDREKRKVPLKSVLDSIMKIISVEKFVNVVKSYEGFKILKNQDFLLKSADLWFFQIVFPNFRVFRETFLRFCWHIVCVSEGFWV